MAHKVLRGIELIKRDTIINGASQNRGENGIGLKICIKLFRHIFRNEVNDTLRKVMSEIFCADRDPRDHPPCKKRA